MRKIHTSRKTREREKCVRVRHADRLARFNCDKAFYPQIIYFQLYSTTAAPLDEWNVNQSAETNLYSTLNEFRDAIWFGSTAGRPTTEISGQFIDCEVPLEHMPYFVNNLRDSTQHTFLCGPFKSVTSLCCSYVHFFLEPDGNDYI